MKDNLRNIGIFSLLDESEIDLFLKILQKKKYKKDDIIFPEGARGREMFIIIKGIVGSRTVLPNGMTRNIAQFEKGDFFGDMSIFENAPRSATCYAVIDSELYTMNDLKFFRFSEKYPEISTKIIYRMLNIITERLREKSKFLSTMVEWGESASKRAISDEIEGIYNRRFLEDSLEKYFKVAENTGKPLCLAMIDVDDFNYFYEKYSSDIITNLLKSIVKTIKNGIRDADIIARYGGDEFTILFPETDISEGFEICNKLCYDVSMIDVSKIVGNPDTNVTISIGISSFPSNAIDLESLRILSDKALYNAKHQGKNRVSKK